MWLYVYMCLGALTSHAYQVLLVFEGGIPNSTTD